MTSMKMITVGEGLRCLLMGCVLLLPQTGALAQQNSEPQHLVSRESKAACEMNNLYIDLLVGEAKKSKERIFIISRLGKGERAKLNWRRLGKAHFFLTDGKEIPSSQIVTAVGTTTRGIGQLEFYLGSKLFLVSEAKKGSDVCLNCCDSPY